MEEETKKQKSVPWSMEFTVPGQNLDVLKRNINRVKALFKAEVKFSTTFIQDQNKKQWINLMGGTATADDMNKAKSYIISMTNPEMCISLENFPAGVFQANKDQVEKDTAAFLQHKNGALIIKGSELAVVLAQSMLESCQTEEATGKAKNSSSKEFSDIEIISAPTSFSSTQTLPDRKSPESSSKRLTARNSSIGNKNQPANSDLTYVKRTAKKSDVAGNSISPKSQQIKERSGQAFAPNFASTFKPQSRTSNFHMIIDSDDEVGAGATCSKNTGVSLQYEYLRNIGVAHRYETDVISEGLQLFDMDDIVKPVEFLKVLQDIQGSKDMINVGGGEPCNSVCNAGASGCQPSTSKSIGDFASSFSSSQRKSKSKTNVIEIDSDSNDGDDSRGRGGDAIVISSDEEAGTNVDLLSKQKWQLKQKKKQTSKAKKKLDELITVNSVPAACAVPVEERKLRYIVIDGSNVAMAHGESRMYSVRGIKICIDYFASRGHKVTAFVPESRRYSNNHIPITEKSLLERLNKDGTLKFTPARRLPTGKVVASYDDRFILNLADVEQGIVVSNDQYRDLIDAKPSYRNIIENRLLPFTFVGDHFMPPDDPLGRDGPPLDYFLSHPKSSGVGSTFAVASGVKKRPLQDWSGVASSQTASASLNGDLAFPELGRKDRLGRQAAGDAVASKWEKPEEKEKGEKKILSSAAIREARLQYFGMDVGQKSGGETGQGYSPPSSASGIGSRSSEQTESLFSQLSLMFPQAEQQERVKVVLRNHPTETDLTRLSNYIISALTLE